MGVVTLGMPYLYAPCCVQVYWYGLTGAIGGGGDMAHPYQPHAGVGGLGGGGGGEGGGGLGGGSGGGGASGILELTSKLPDSPYGVLTHGVTHRWKSYWQLLHTG